MNMYIGNKLQSPNVEKLRKIALCTILSVFLCIIMSACRSHDLTKAQIQKFKVEFCAEDSNEYIIVSGIPSNSALIIKRVEITDMGSSVNITAEQQLCGPVSGSGIGLPFYLKIQISKDINTVTLGKEEEVIWERKQEIQ